MMKSLVRGVSLLEVLIALVVTSIGLLGIAKMQALALSSTRGSSTRSLISIEAAGMASAMHANEKYWKNVLASTSSFYACVNGTASTSSSSTACTFSSVGAISSSDSTLAYSTNCASASCAGTTNVAMAAYDLQSWGTNLNSIVPQATGSVNCSGSPATCTIGVSWNENMVGLNLGVNGVAGASITPTGSQTQTLTFQLLVQP